MDRRYAERVANEKNVYDQNLHVHDLPPIFHYWSNTYVRPIFRRFGFDDLKDVFKDYLEAQCDLNPDRRTRFISVGSGNCDFEVELVSHLRSRGKNHFLLECLDLNATMLNRGRAAAGQLGLSENIDFIQGDFNDWTPGAEYDAVVANQSLHHVLKLEHLFAQIKDSLTPDGVFIISDMIGRNGHQRWPEALQIVHEFWRDLPPSYRFNHSLGRYQELFENWDCSVEGFEGIRSQDILPLLNELFHFRLFLPFGNVIDPFTDRPFGVNFDASAAWDRAFIDRVQQRDEREISSGRLTPTHMLAVVGTRPYASPLIVEPLTPEFCKRPADRNGLQYSLSLAAAYHWGSWPHSVQSELETACDRLKIASHSIIELEREVQDRTAWARDLERQLAERTAWALRTDDDLKRRTAWAFQLEEEIGVLKRLVPDLQSELVERTAWARDLESQVAERTTWAQQLDRTVDRLSAQTGRLEVEVEKRTAWAHDLESQLLDRTEWARQLEAENLELIARTKQLEGELHGYIHNPYRYVKRLTLGIGRRIKRLLDSVTRV